MSNIKNKKSLEILAKQVRSDIVHMVHIASSGHLGGPLGFTEPFLLAVDNLNLDSNNPYNPAKDKLVVSAGHYSALVYSTLTNMFLKDKHDLVVSKFRSLDDVVEGHVTHRFPFIWDSTGHLGYGPSIAAGHAIADKLLNYNDTKILCTMGDGEQTKGPIPEALRFIKKYCLDNITILVDCNGQQISTTTKKVMPMDIKANFEANGWEDVKEINGYDINEISKALDSNSNAILAQTVMGKGVQESEGTHEYHGKPISGFEQGLKDLGVENKLEHYKKLRESNQTTGFAGRPIIKPLINSGSRIVYNDKADCRGAWGKALVDIANNTLNSDGTPKKGNSPITVFDCDLAGSVQTQGFAKAYPDKFYQAGIQENSTAVIAGTVSTRGISTWVAMFGSFGHGMCYNEHLLTAINDGNLKLVTTHNSIDVGEDSKTHSPIGYLCLENHPGWDTFVPADANQTDAIVRHMATNYGNMHMPVGRSKIEIIKKQNSDEPFFDNEYTFTPENGCFEKLRDFGNDYVIVTYGTPTGKAVDASEKLYEQNINGKVINVSTPTNISDNILGEIANTNLIVTFEDHNVNTGIARTLDSKILMSSNSKPEEIIHIGLSGYSKSAPSEHLYKHFGISEDNLINKIEYVLKK
jgi:transketolase